MGRGRDAIDQVKPGYYKRPVENSRLAHIRRQQKSNVAGPDGFRLRRQFPRKFQESLEFCRVIRLSIILKPVAPSCSVKNDRRDRAMVRFSIGAMVKVGDETSHEFSLALRPL
jgi:hypothetical protein